MLRPTPVAEFYADVMIALKELGLDVTINTTPCEIADCIPFEQDSVHFAYDADAVRRFWRVLLSINHAFWRFRSGFLGKPARCISSGQFRSGGDAIFRADRAASSRRVPHLPNEVAAEAYSHEVSSAGFWPARRDLWIIRRSIPTLTLRRKALPTPR